MLIYKRGGRVYHVGVAGDLNFLSVMEFRDRALVAVEAAEQGVREQRKAIIRDAINAEPSGDVAAIARMTGTLSNCTRC